MRKTIFSILAFIAKNYPSHYSEFRSAESVNSKLFYKCAVLWNALCLIHMRGATLTDSTCGFTAGWGLFGIIAVPTAAPPPAALIGFLLTLLAHILHTRTWKTNLLQNSNYKNSDWRIIPLRL